mmetsp:Transcript_7826/g.16278  ORF Transcript_7826/g.16278 Transcript_7826/m.16278 type:complete len:207 (-) Transcript_7826:89-709(-)
MATTCISSSIIEQQVAMDMHPTQGSCLAHCPLHSIFGVSGKVLRHPPKRIQTSAVGMQMPIESRHMRSFFTVNELYVIRSSPQASHVRIISDFKINTTVGSRGKEHSISSRREVVVACVGLVFFVPRILRVVNQGHYFVNAVSRPHNADRIWPNGGIGLVRHGDGACAWLFVVCQTGRCLSSFFCDSHERRHSLSQSFKFHDTLRG